MLLSDMDQMGSDMILVLVLLVQQLYGMIWSKQIQFHIVDSAKLRPS